MLAKLEVSMDGVEYEWVLTATVAAWGYAETGPTWDCGGEPACPPEWEYWQVFSRPLGGAGGFEVSSLEAAIEDGLDSEEIEEAFNEAADEADSERRFPTVWDDEE